jgi:hypothetical protein
VKIELEPSKSLPAFVTPSANEAAFKSPIKQFLTLGLDESKSARLLHSSLLAANKLSLKRDSGESGYHRLSFTCYDSDGNLYKFTAWGEKTAKSIHDRMELLFKLTPAGETFSLIELPGK